MSEYVSVNSDTYQPTVKCATIIKIFCSTSATLTLLHSILILCSSWSGRFRKSGFSELLALPFDLTMWSDALLIWKVYDRVKSSVCHVKLVLPVSHVGNQHFPGDEARTECKFASFNVIH